ncbi:DNA ligase, ATP-dependent, central [Niveomyces insectorum RCEF 264]|uniref:DNA ligase, ATP-dependent, central n=1 Tax=Niveomyces insectorum RCEF 264 TaxID=1081102 RepID=A0A162JA21_9HYPO|nr:DNA ligase, ATP-dependent, central [Niveomyces insectorum RCEF 264]
MPFPFSYVCDLLQQVADLPLHRRNQKRIINELVRAWFDRHRAAVDGLLPRAGGSPLNKPAAASTTSATPETPVTPTAPATTINTTAAAALLAALLPDYRTDRVYGLQAASLQRIVVRAFGLGRSRLMELNRWTRPGLDGQAVDLADCIEKILEITPNPCHPVPVSVEEIDAALLAVAGRCRFSSPAVRAAAAASAATTGTTAPLLRDRTIGCLYQRLDARGAKWFTRLILKDYRPVVLDVTTVTRALHPGLPLALQVHSDFGAALQSLAGSGGGGSSSRGDGGNVGNGDGDGDGDESVDKPSVGPRQQTLTPRLGVKVGRQPWAKARSIQHCLALGGPRRMSCERKLDGEYVQVHVDLTRLGPDDNGNGRRSNCLQLFSKSGKDSTWDRINLHSAILASLRIGEPDCKIKTGCILEGEMLAYDEKEGKVLDFDAVRNHVTRSGSMLYCDTPSESRVYEHLMIVYYDVLLVDGQSLLGVRHADRFRRLEDLITCRPGYAELVPRQVIDFRSHTAAAELRQAFARCITARLEGLVLKPEDDPYFDLTGPTDAPPPRLEWPYMRSYAIKLKKEYIGAFGEVGDFAVVGARYDAAKAKEYPPDLPGLRWTHFYVGCLDTGAHSPAAASRPRFVVTNVVTLTVAQMTAFLRYCRPRVVPVEKKQDRRKREHRGGETEAGATIHTNGAQAGERAPFDLAPLEPGLDDGRSGPTDLFADPPVVDIRCFSFHRPGYGNFWCPRFPSVVKFHFDRTYRDVLTFADLQTMAEGESTRRSAAATADADDDDDNDDDEEHARWVAQLKGADPRGIAVDAETSQSSGRVTTSNASTTTRSQSSDEGGVLVTGPPPTKRTTTTVQLATTVEEKDEEVADRPASSPSATPKASGQPDGTATRNVTVIDLTGEDDDDDETPSPTPRPLGLPALCESPATPAITTSPASTPPPTSPQPTPQLSPSPPSSQLASSSPVPLLSSLAGHDVLGSSQTTVDNTPCSATMQGRKRLCMSDAGGEPYPIVSPPQLKRTRRTL